MGLIENIYTGVLHGVRLALPIFSAGEGKLARGVRGRRDALARLEAWGREHRDRSRPLVWFHAPSVGEGLQARAVMEELRGRLPEAQIAYTHFSPSAESLARSLPADITDYLPFDAPTNVRRIFDSLSPSLVAFSKTEVWPNVTKEAERRGVPIILLSATLPASSSRLKPFARALLGPAHRRLTHVAAIAPADAERFGALGVSPDRRSVMGDARFDQVWRRVQRPGSGREIADRLRDPGLLTIVAGSTWPADEDALLRAYANLRSDGSPATAHPSVSQHGARLILVPHEPTESHLARLDDVLSRLSLDSVRLSVWLDRQVAPIHFGAEDQRGGIAGRSSEMEMSPNQLPDLIVVDRVGILGDLYRLADIAYVGGGFGRAGLHSVLEPAAFGVPVVFGPRHDNSREAAALVGANGAVAVNGSDDLTGVLERWSSDPEARADAGARARRFVEENLGAAGKGAELIVALLPEDGFRHSPE